jgi:hypothetical protein
MGRLTPIVELGVAEAFVILTEQLGVSRESLPPLDAIENEDWGRDLLLSRLHEVDAVALAAVGLCCEVDDDEPASGRFTDPRSPGSRGPAIRSVCCSPAGRDDQECFTARFLALEGAGLEVVPPSCPGAGPPGSEPGFPVAARTRPAGPCALVADRAQRGREDFRTDSPQRRTMDRIFSI